jgi:hypothetical protein
MQSRFMPAAVSGVVLCVLASQASAAIQPVFFNVLNASATLPTPFAANDVLRLDTLVTTETGPLTQRINFTLAPDVAGLTGQASWEIDTATGVGPRLVGVNIDIFDSSNVLVTSDTFAGTLAGFAHSTFLSSIAPGNYYMLATGTGVRASSLDVTLTFTPIPEPTTLAAAGLTLTLLRRRR